MNARKGKRMMEKNGGGMQTTNAIYELITVDRVRWVFVVLFIGVIPLNFNKCKQDRNWTSGSGPLYAEK